MNESLRLEFEEQCKLVVDNIERNYAEELKYNGRIKTIYSKFVNAIGVVELCDDLNSISFKGCLGLFVDDSEEFLDPIILEIEKAEDILEQMRKSNNS